MGRPNLPKCIHLYISFNSVPVFLFQLRAESECLESPRPLSENSDISVEVGGTLGKRNRNKQLADKHRPLTRYLPIRGSDLDLRQHIESAGKVN